MGVEGVAAPLPRRLAFGSSAVRSRGILAAFLLLSGCLTAAQTEDARMRTEAHETAELAKPCFQNILDNPEYAQLKKKMYLAMDTQVPLQMLTDKTLPTKSEIVLLYKVYGDVQECRKGLLAGVAKVHPLVLLTFADTFTESDKLWTEAVAGHLPWGKFNEAKKDIGARGQERLLQAGARINAQLQNQHRFEVEQRTRAIEAFARWSAAQAALASSAPAVGMQPSMMPTMRTTNCSYMGNMLNCTSF
jgi:hypothetical protein